MSNTLLEIGRAQASWNVSGTRILKYSIEIYHKGLNEHKVISAPDMQILQNKVDLQAQKWEALWERIEEKRSNYQEKEASIEKAANLTQDAEKSITAIDNLLLHTLSIDDTIDWDELKRKDDFLEKKPQKTDDIPLAEYPPKPVNPIIVFGLLDKIFKSRKEKRIKKNADYYTTRVNEWDAQKVVVDEENRRIEMQNTKTTKDWRENTRAWDDRKAYFYKEREEYNQKIDQLKENYFAKNPDAVIEYCDLVLNNSLYPDTFPKSFELEYVADTKILVVEYQLPNQTCLPIIKEVKYIASRKELKESFITEIQQTKMYDEAIYKIALRSIHELFEADESQAIDAISFNGWVKAINKATGKEENNCILSIQVKRTEFSDIDLAHVDPKTCFRNLKGVASSKLSSLTPIQPILQISKVDKRFVEGHAVVGNIDDSTNLAAMDWEEFEHLIRELFEKEFLSNGGEVKITQASRDGGVDAVAFDPDPIRGGKIVIQAKRYTNTVGVSAVRDLYGTTLNEGATKGILVSTADYGPDAYEFAKGKPLTLLNGSHLLHLLQKHGYHAKIDLKEAKKILSENSF